MRGEIDLIPDDYLRSLELRGWLRYCALALVGVVVAVAVAKVGLFYGIRAHRIQIEKLEVAEAVALAQQARLAELRRTKQDAAVRLSVLSGLRGGVAARQMFAGVDRAMDDQLWFLEWAFQRAGKLVEKTPQSVQTGYFIVVPDGEDRERQKAWLMHTHMEIRAQAVDHSTLANFVRRLVEQPEIDEVRVLRTRVHRYTKAQVVDFEIAVVVRTAA